MYKVKERRQQRARKEKKKRKKRRQNATKTGFQTSIFEKQKHQGAAFFQNAIQKKVQSREYLDEKELQQAIAICAHTCV